MIQTADLQDSKPTLYQLSHATSRLSIISFLLRLCQFFIGLIIAQLVDPPPLFREFPDLSIAAAQPTSQFKYIQNDSTSLSSIQRYVKAQMSLLYEFLVLFFSSIGFGH
jgi:hypothetical protein